MDLGFAGGGGTEVLSMADGQIMMHDPLGGVSVDDDAASADDEFDAAPPTAQPPGKRGTAGGLGPPSPAIARPPAQSSGGMAALELADADLIPLELAPLEAAAPKPGAEPKPTTMPRLSLGSMATVRDAAAPVVMLLADSEGRHFDATEPLGSMPLLPTIQADSPGAARRAPRPHPPRRAAAADATAHDVRGAPATDRRRAAEEEPQEKADDRGRRRGDRARGRR